MEDNKPYIASSHDVKLDKEYNDWLNELDSRYVRACQRAAVKVKNSNDSLENCQLLIIRILKNSTKLVENWNTK